MTVSETSQLEVLRSGPGDELGWSEGEGGFIGDRYRGEEAEGPARV